MVDLLKDRKKGLGNWKDPRFDPEPHESAGDKAEAPIPQLGKATLSTPTLRELIPEPSTRPRIISVKEEIPAPREKVPQSRPGESSTLHVDFLPGSLADLFETTEDFSAEPLTKPEIEAHSNEIAPLPVHTASEELQGPPAKLFESTGKLHNEPVQEHETTLQPVEMAPISIQTNS